MTSSSALLLTAALFLPHAQEAAPAGATQEAPFVKEDRGAKHLLHTADGRVLRVRARQVDGRWEVQGGEEWRPLPASFVERAVLEKDALREAKELARELGRKPAPEQRTAYADWLAREGLYPEAVEQLDRVFEEERNPAGALALLERVDVPLRLPDPASDLDGFLRQAAHGSPAGREIAVRRLAPLVDGGTDLFTKLHEELVAETPARRAFAALALRRTFAGRAVKTLLGRSLLDASAQVRVEASRALGDVGDPAVSVPALNALSSKHPKLALHAAEALGEMGYPEVVEPMISYLATAQSASGGRAPHQHIFIGKQFAYVQDFDVEVAQFQAIADPIINVGLEGNVLDVAVVGASTVTTQMASVRRSLGRLTGHTGRTNRAWRQWWTENGDAWRTRTKGDGPTSGG